MIRDSVQENLRKAYGICKKHYNLRSRPLNIKFGDIVFRRNFVLSRKISNFNAKLAPKFIKSKVLRIKGNCYYELQDVKTGSTGIYHGVDLKRS